MDRFQNTIDRIRTRNKYRYFNDQEIMKTYHIKTDLTREATDEIERALWDIKDSMDIPTEEIELAIESRRKIK
jgi:hypothetical protein